MDVSAGLVVQAENRRARTGLPAENLFLCGDVAVEPTVALQMIGRNVKQESDVEGDAERQFQLVARHLQHVAAAVAGGGQLQHRQTDVAADLGIDVAKLQHVAEQRRGRRLAVGPGDADVARIGLGAAKQLNVADDLRPGLARQFDDRVRCRMAVRDARRENQRCRLLPVAAVEIYQRHAALRSAGTGVLAVVPGPDFGAAGLQRTRCCQAGSSEPEHPDRQAMEEGKFDHRAPPLIAVSRWRGRSAPARRR